MNIDPSLATPRKTYSPGVSNVTCDDQRLPAGGRGIVNGGDQGELAYTRESIYVFICVGSKEALSAGPRYTVQENLSPGPDDTTIDWGGR